MWHRKQLLYLLYSTILFVQYGRAVKPIAVSSLLHLLRNLSNCDVQIIHSGESEREFPISGLNMVATSIFAPKYALLYIHSLSTREQLPATNILKSRVSTCRLSFIFISVSPRERNFNYIERWFSITSEYHLYHLEIEKLYRIFLPNSKTIINFITTIPIRQFELNLPYEMFHSHFVYYFSVIIAKEGKSLEICFPPLISKFGFYQLHYKMNCISEYSLNNVNYVSLVKKLTPNHERWCLLEFQWSKINASGGKNGINTSVKQLALDIFSS